MRRLAPPLCLLTLSLLAAGCNRGETTVLDGRTVRLEAGDYRITPQRVRVQRGRVTFEVRNESARPHNWTLARRGREKGRITTLLPGESGEVTIRLRRGVYRMACTISHHEVLGEYGTVSVR